MKVGIAGLGLIGGSFARDYNNAGHTVYAYNRTKNTLEYAKLAGVVDGELDENTIPECDLILVALFPEETIAYMKKIAPYVSKNTVVIDCGGTKRVICSEGFALAEKYGYTYVGGHPMAGTQYSGFKNSFAGMYKGAPMVIVPPVTDDIELLAKVKKMLEPAGFGRISVSSADAHDKTIAFTSQLAHVVSVSYIKSPTALSHDGISAGSYKDMTRVARLNENMWSDLFLENADNLVSEIDHLVDSLTDIRNAINDGNREKLVELLGEGRKLKEKVDGHND